jgi:hypothetical protein
MLRVGKIIGETALLYQKIQMSGDRNLTQVCNQILGEIPH